MSGRGHEGNPSDDSSTNYGQGVAEAANGDFFVVGGYYKIRIHRIQADGGEPSVLPETFLGRLE